jgi:acetylornithine deacetylase
MHSDAPPAAAEARRITTVEMLDRLIAFDTTSRNSNLPLMDFIGDYLRAHGVPFRVSHDPTGQKANIHAVIGTAGPGGLALSGHVDTVPVEGQVPLCCAGRATASLGAAPPT